MGWYLLSLALTDRARQRDSLKRALQANPANTAAQERLASLSEPEAVSAQPVIQAPPAARVDAPVRAPAMSAWGTGLQRPPTRPSQAASPPAVGEPFTSSDWAALRAKSAIPVASRPRNRSKIALVVLVGVLAVAVLIAGSLYVLRSLNHSPVRPVAPALITALASPVATAQPTSLPTSAATWTAAPQPTGTPTTLATITDTPAPQGTLAPADATVAASMDQVEKQVAVIRGLAPQGSTTRYLIPPARVEETLRTIVIKPALVSWLDDQRISLSALGLITPTYDLTRYALNRSTDNLGGFYLSTPGQIYVIGNQFTGVGRFIFAHEVDRELTDQNFNTGDPGASASCDNDAQRCDARRALVEGDATLLMSLWLRQDGTAQDTADLASYKPMSQTLPEDSQPPFIAQQLAFPHVQGLAFVSQLYQQGKWAAVNAAYADPPASTAQILHLDKYRAHKAPSTVTDAALSAALGGDWRKVDDGVLGEWSTYLLLGYGVDPAARLDVATAITATSGWSGDHYQVFYNDATKKTVMAAHWAWDTVKIADNFAAALRQYQDLRYRGARVDMKSGSCWANAGQTSCIFTTGLETLWLLAPDQTVLANVLSLSPRFH